LQYFEKNQLQVYAIKNSVGTFYILILFRCRFHCGANRIVPVRSQTFVSQASEARGAIPNFWKRVIGLAESPDNA